ncbi:MAG: EamA family transporter [Planctomycetota bacterium]
MNIRKVDLSATFACVGVLFCWSLGPIFISYLTGYVDSWTQNLLRYSAACLFWLPFLLLSIKRKQIDARIWRKAILPAGANIIFQSLWAGAFYFIGPAFMVLLTKTSVIWIAGFSLIFFPEERPLVKSKRFWSGLALSAMGVIGVMYYKVDLAATNTIIGIFIALATAFMWGVCVVISGVMCIAFGHVLYYAAMRRIGATIPALVILAQPFTVLAISNVVFGESLNVFQLVFGLVLLAGSALAIWAQQHLKRTT